ncbi:hypothetical protein N7U49_42565 [Streptomyces sp. AD2-2]|nr:hypothetical protein N7U49_42565 [Streptomyces sp. AD2-2]
MRAVEYTSAATSFSSCASRSATRGRPELIEADLGVRHQVGDELMDIALEGLTVLPLVPLGGAVRVHPYDRPQRADSAPLGGEVPQLAPALGHLDGTVGVAD